jgi:glycosyltransferase involved in cell wall biosynthesis
MFEAKATTSSQGARNRQNGHSRVVLDARTASDHFPGIGRYVTSLSRALLTVAPELPLVLLYQIGAGATRLALPDAERIACPGSPFSVRQQWSVRRCLRQAGAHLYHSAYYLMPYLPGVPTILTCYDLIPLVHPGYYTSWQRLVFRVAHGFALRAACHVLAISETTKADLVARLGLRPEHITVTPLAAGARFRPQTGEQITAVRRKYHLPDRYILYVGSNKPHKNLLRLVQAYDQVKRRQPQESTALVIAGRWDPRYAEAKIQAQKLGITDATFFLGSIADGDLPALYSGATLFVFPSQYEGFGLPLLEAMACGVPVACANASSLPEVAEDAAALFDPNDTEAITATLETLLPDADRRAELAQRSLRRASHFSWQKTAALTLDAYEMVQMASQVGYE